MAYLVSAHVSQQTYGGWPNYVYGEQRNWPTAPGWPNYGQQGEYQTAFSSSYVEQTDWPMSPPSSYLPEEVPPEEDVPPEEGEIRQITEEQRFVYESIGDVLDEVIEEVPEIEEEKPSTRCVKCLDYCCQGCTCSSSVLCSNPCRRSSTGESRFTPLEIMTPVLRRGRSTGWRMWKKFAFPLVNDIVRDVWIVTELLFTLTALALSAASFHLAGNTGTVFFNIFHLALSVFSTALATIDAFTNLSQCKSCKKCHEKCCSQQNASTSQPTIRDPETPCRKCAKRCSEVSDIVRMLASELILYPLFVCDMFEFITGKPWQNPKSADIICMILFSLSLLAMVLYVYILRIVILGYLIKFVHQQRKPISKNPAYWQKYDYDPNISKSALYFQTYFFFHILGQMIAQILSLIAIGAKIQYDNDNRSCEHVDPRIHVSGFLWYMIVSGYVLPLCGVLTFFIVTYYWVQEFPIGLCLDILSLLQMPDVNTIFYPNESTAEVRKKVTKLLQHMTSSSLKQQFLNIHNKGVVSDKILFPFKSPVLIILSIIYGALQFGFILCAAYAINNAGQVVPVILNDGGGWIIFYGISVAFGVLANLYVFLVAALWVIIIVGTIALIALIISGLILCFFMAACISSDSD